MTIEEITKGRSPRVLFSKKIRVISKTKYLAISLKEPFSHFSTIIYKKLLISFDIFKILLYLSPLKKNDSFKEIEIAK